MVNCGMACEKTAGGWDCARFKSLKAVSRDAILIF
jgi:hypothetical protein